jgi:hypothetical protein
LTGDGDSILSDVSPGGGFGNPGQIALTDLGQSQVIAGPVEDLLTESVSLGPPCWV